MTKEYEENYECSDSPKQGGVLKLKNYYILGALLVLFIIAFSLFFYEPNENDEYDGRTLLMCGDGTFSSECSLNRPYYCDGGDLVYENSLCGCPESLRKKGDICESKYFKDEKKVSLKYFLNEAEGEIIVSMYGDVSDYLDTLERHVVYLLGEIPRRSDSKSIKIDDEVQREALMDLVVNIQNIAPNSLVDQARIATSLVQNIKYKESEFGNFRGVPIRFARYPYQVIERGVGSCEGKSELLVLLLREIGYGTATFYYNKENHEAVGIKCPVEKSLMGSGYCFIETTVPSLMTYSTGNYLIGDGEGKKLGIPKIIILSKGISLPDDIVEYEDVKKIEKLLEGSTTTILDRKALNVIYRKYGMPELNVI